MIDTIVEGNSLEKMPLLDSGLFDCIWTDPPYFLSNGGSTCASGKRVKVDKGGWDNSNGVLADHEFNIQWLTECYRILKLTGTIWVSGTIHNYPSIALAMQTIGFRILNDIVWEKTCPPPNLGCRCFTHSTEIILWASKGAKFKHCFNYEEMKAENGGKQMKNVWRFSPPGKAEKLHGKHPTQKPIALIDRCLRASTNPGDLVFDPFAGSGTTGVAALRLKRSFFGIEMDPDFVKLANDRLQDLT